MHYPMEAGKLMQRFNGTLAELEQVKCVIAEAGGEKIDLTAELQLDDISQVVLELQAMISMKRKLQGDKAGAKQAHYFLTHWGKPREAVTKNIRATGKAMRRRVQLEAKCKQPVTAGCCGEVM